MDITKEQIEKMATEYAKQFDYAEDSSPFLDFIAGFEKALSLLTISEQKKHLSCPHCESSDIDFDENFCTNCSEYVD